MTGPETTGATWRRSDFSKPSSMRGRMVVERPNRKLADLSFCAAGRPSEPATGRYREIVRNLGEA